MEYDAARNSQAGMELAQLFQQLLALLLLTIEICLLLIEPGAGSCWMPGRPPLLSWRRDVHGLLNCQKRRDDHHIFGFGSAAADATLVVAAHARGVVEDRPQAVSPVTPRVVGNPLAHEQLAA